MKEIYIQNSENYVINKSGCGHLPQSRQEGPTFGKTYLNDRVDERIQQDIDDYNYEYLVQELDKIVWKGSDTMKGTNQLTQSINSTTKTIRPHKIR